MSILVAQLLKTFKAKSVSVFALRATVNHGWCGPEGNLEEQGRQGGEGRADGYREREGAAVEAVRCSINLVIKVALKL